MLVPNQGSAMYPVPVPFPVLYEGESNPEDLDAEINHSAQELERLQEIEKTLLSEFDKVAVRYRSHFPQIISRLTDMEAEYLEATQELQALLDSDGESKESEASEPEPEQPEVPDEEATKKLRKLKRDTLKKYYRRICIQCHPDKTRLLPDDVVAALSQLFLEAKQAYQNDDLDTILELYASACALRETESVDDTYLKAKKERLDRIKSLVDRAVSRLNEMRTYVIYAVYECDKQGMVEHAKSHYRAILNYNLDHGQSRLEAIRKQIEDIKKAKENERA